MRSITHTHAYTSAHTYVFFLFAVHRRYDGERLALVVERLHLDAETLLTGTDPAAHDVLHVEAVPSSGRRAVQVDLLTSDERASSLGSAAVRRDVLIDEDPCRRVGGRRRPNVHVELSAHYGRPLHVRLEGEEADVRFVDTERRGRCDVQKAVLVTS